MALRRVDQVLREAVADRGERPGDRDDQDVDVGIVEDRVEDLRPPLVAGGMAAGVDRVRHAQVLGDPLVQRGLRRGRELRQAQPDRRRPVRDVRVGPPGDGVDRDAVPAGTTAPREHGGDLEQLVEPVDADHAELPEHRVEHPVASREMAGVRLDPRPPDVAAARFDQHDRNAPPRRTVRGQHERPAVLEPLDVAGDRADVGLLGEVRDHVGGLDVAFVAGERPAPQRDAEILGLIDGPPLVPALRDQGDALARQVIAERLEGVQRGVRADQPGVGVGDDGLQLPLPRNALAAHLGEPRCEHEDERDLLVDAGLQRLLRGADQHDRDVDVFRDVEDGSVTALAVDRVAVRVHRIDDRAVRALLLPVAHQPEVQRRRAARRVGRTDHRDRPGVEEPVEVELAQREGATRDVDVGGRHPDGF